MRSIRKKNSSKPSGRILLLCGETLAGYLGIDLSFLFTKAGFQVQPVVACDVSKWISTSSLSCFTGNEPISPASPVSRFVDSSDFSLAILAGPDLNCLSGTNSVFNTVYQKIRKDKIPFFLLTDDGGHTEMSLFSEISGSCLALVSLSGNPFRARESLSKVFASAVLFLKRRKLLKNYGVSFSHSLIEPIPQWIKELKMHIELAGFAIMDSDGGSDVHIETYEGPLSVSPGNDGRITLDPGDYHCRPDAKFTIRFVHVDVPQDSIMQMVSEKLQIVTRSKNGDLIVYQNNKIRMIPELLKRRALSRFTELLVQRFDPLESGDPSGENQ